MHTCLAPQIYGHIVISKPVLAASVLTASQLLIDVSFDSKPAKRCNVYVVFYERIAYTEVQECSRIALRRRYLRKVFAAPRCSESSLRRMVFERCMFWQSLVRAITMAISWSVGDVITCSQLAYKLIRALKDTGGAKGDYQDLINDPSSIHRTLLKVEQMHHATRLTTATVNATLFEAHSLKRSWMISLQQLKPTIVPYLDCLLKAQLVDIKTW